MSLFRRNTLWTLAGSGLPFLLGLVTIPYLIKKSGVEAFGVLTLIWALIGYFSLFDFGLGRALTQQVATARASNSLSRLPSLAKTGLAFTAVAGIVGGVLLAVLAQPLALRWLNVSVRLQPEVFTALLLAAVGIPLTTLTTGLRGILEGFEDFKRVNLLRMALGTANFGLPALTAMFMGPSLIWMVLSLILARAVVLVIHFFLVRLHMPVGWERSDLSRDDMKGLLSFGAWMTVSNIVSPLMVTADRFLISAVLGASVVAYYTVPFEVLMRVLILPGALTGVLFPRITALMGADPAKARQLYRNCLKVLGLMLAPICIAIMLGSKWGMTQWLGSEFAEHSWKLVCVLAVGLFLNGIAHVPFAAVQASGDARRTAHLHLFELVLYVPLLFVSMKLMGVMGAAIAWSVRVGLDLVMLLFYARKKGL